MKGFQIDGWRGRFRVSLSSEYPGSPFEQLRLPLGDLVGMDIELLRQFGQCLLALDRGQSHFGVVVCSLSLLLRSHSGRAQAETPLMPLSKFVGPPLSIQTTGSPAAFKNATAMVTLARFPIQSWPHRVHGFG
jgi:hypothetical protein